MTKIIQSEISICGSKFSSGIQARHFCLSEPTFTHLQNKEVKNIYDVVFSHFKS